MDVSKQLCLLVVDWSTCVDLSSALACNLVTTVSIVSSLARLGLPKLTLVASTAGYTPLCV